MRASDLRQGPAVLAGWVVLNIVVFVLAFMRDFESSGERKAARALGHLNLLNMGLAIITATRNSILVPLLGVTFERAIAYHRCFAITTVLLVAVHALIYIQQFSTKLLDFAFDVVGIFAAVAMFLMAALAFERIRRRRFEVFFYSHLLLLPAAVILSFVHGAFPESYKGSTKPRWYPFVYLLPAVLLLLADKWIRYRRYTASSDLLSASLIKNADKPSESDRFSLLKIRVPFKYGPGSFAFVNVPAISKAQQHPFSIASATGTNEATFCIKDEGPGTWTNALADLCSKDAEAGANFQISVEGPYGCPAIQIDTYLHAILIAGGVGVTPILSVLEGLSSSESQLRSVQVIWVVRDLTLPRGLWSRFAPLLAGSDPAITVQIHVTKGVEGDADGVDGAEIEHGRPNIPAMIASLVADKDAPGALLCSGPGRLVSSVRAAAKEKAKGWAFSDESFVL